MGHLDPEVLTETWDSYKSGSNPGQRNVLVLHYTSLVRYVATKVAAGLPSMVEKDDLISYGMFGLMDAIEKFDLEKGVKFETYAVARIRGAIYDEIRALDWVPRSIRSKARDIERARGEVEAELGRPAEHQEVAQNLGLNMDEYWKLASEASVAPIEHLPGPGSMTEDYTSHETKYDPSANPEELFEISEITELIADAILAMDERSKTILVLYYLQEMTLAEIGQMLGVTESRVCQLQSKVLHALGESLRGGLSAA